MINDDDLEPLGAGRIVLFTAGEYSMYGCIALVRVLRRFVPSEAEVAHAATAKDTPDFLAWLEAQGYVESIPYVEWWVG